MIDKIIQTVEAEETNLDEIRNAVAVIMKLIDSVNDTKMPRESLQGRNFGQLRSVMSALSELLKTSEEFYTTEVLKVAEATITK